MGAVQSSDREPGWARALEAMAASTERLVADAERLDDAAVRAPSRCPGWTRGHVLAHVARNADGLVRLADWARTGRERPMYDGGRAGRDAEIEAGAGRGLAEHLADLRTSASRLAEALADLPEPARQRPLRLASGTPLTGADLPASRMREVEIHHVDLDVDYTPAHWPADFTATALDHVSAFVRVERDYPVSALHGTGTGRQWPVGRSGPTLRGPESALLAWATGRSDGDGLQTDDGAPVPAAPRWT